MEPKTQNQKPQKNPNYNQALIVILVLAGLVGVGWLVFTNISEPEPVTEVGEQPPQFVPADFAEPTYPPSDMPPPTSPPPGQ